MTRATRFTIEELTPKFMDQSERFNDWYFTVHFTHEGKKHLVKLAITEGSLLGQMTQLTLSRDPASLKDEGDAVTLSRSVNDISLTKDEAELLFSQSDDQVKVEMGCLTAICGLEQQRIISTNETISADLTFKPRGPMLHWKHEAGAVCQVTDVTRVSGSESLSDVQGTLTVNGQEMQVEGRGLFEHVWFSALNFFEIRAMDWFYGHFDEMYLYLCHCESITSESKPFHFETGEMYIIINDDFLPAKSLEVEPESWVFLEDFRRFIPSEQSVVVRTDQGTLKLKTRLLNYPLFIQDPARLEGLTIDNVPGWSSIFCDVPITLEGKFTYKDGRVIELTNGVGMNEVIRISPL
ncbi:MAG: hypothetical protein B6I35_09915 [Anaerolineaceae bacterium 4572_32.2]|nr:MAG: hypothetical protein B6I35_09915 [Anaerolineaceae bacterium 4572_32.2]RLC75743.1 MAG: hypothetical protein DRI81_11465 [Chloroflexota bacterium]